MTSAENRIMLGGAGSSVVIADIAASTNAQSGPVDGLTVDTSGVLGRASFATANGLAAANTWIDLLDTQIGSLNQSLAGLQGQVGTLFDLTETIDRDAQRGIASIAAAAHPHFPSEAGKTSYASNVATYRGEVGFSAGLMHRLDSDFAVTAGVSYAGGNSTAVRAGIAGEFRLRKLAETIRHRKVLSGTFVIKSCRA